MIGRFGRSSAVLHMPDPPSPGVLEEAPQLLAGTPFSPHGTRLVLDERDSTQLILAGNKGLNKKLLTAATKAGNLSALIQALKGGANVNAVDKASMSFALTRSHLIFPHDSRTTTDFIFYRRAEQLR